MTSKVRPEVDGFHSRNVMFHDCAKRHLWRFFYHDMYQRCGNEYSFSPGFGTDLWAFLSNDIPTAYLVGSYFAFELIFIGAFGALLFAANGIDTGGFWGSVLASARAVTMLANWGSNQFDFVGDGNGGASEKLSLIGALILMIEGFLHFMFVCVASSLIIVRALRPLQQVAFSHHCCLTDDELVLRIRILRPFKTVLIRPEVKLDVCLTSGTFVKLQLVGDGQYAKWSGNPTITIRHKINEDSPFFLERETTTTTTTTTAVTNTSGSPAEEAPALGKVRSTLDGIAHLSCSLVATDTNGIPIAEVQQYTPMAGFSKMLMDQYFESDEAFRNQIPQILHHVKFQDQITRFGVASAGELERTPSKPWHPHGSVKNMELRRRKRGGQYCGNTSGEALQVKRLVTDSDNFCRLAATESAIGRASNSHSTIAEGSDKLEKKHTAK